MLAILFPKWLQSQRLKHFIIFVCSFCMIRLLGKLEYLEKSNSDMDFTLHTGRKIPASRIAFRTRTNFSIGMKMSQRAPSLKAFDVSNFAILIDF